MPLPRAILIQWSKCLEPNFEIEASQKMAELLLLPEGENYHREYTGPTPVSAGVTYPFNSNEEHWSY
jgi:hypothetical protein